MRKGSIKGKAVDSCCDLSNLITNTNDKPAIKAINALEKQGITKITQIVYLVDNFGEREAIRMLTSLPRIGKPSAEEIILRSITYEYPKGYSPVPAELPEVFRKSAEEDGEAEITKSSSEESEEIVEVKILEDAQEVDNMCINIEDYASKLINDEQLVVIFGNLICDLFNDDSQIIPERANAKFEYSQDNVVYDSKFIYVGLDFIKNLFIAKVRNLKTVGNRNPEKMWYYVLDTAPYISRYVVNGITYCFGWKPKTFGRDHKIKYVEINITNIEAYMNRELNIASDDLMNQLYQDFNLVNESQSTVTHRDKMIPPTKKIVEEVKPEEKKREDKLYIIPQVSNEGNFEFLVYRIKNPRSFTITGDGISEMKRGIYSYSSDNVEDGELLIGRGFSDKEFSYIENFVKNFLR